MADQSTSLDDVTAADYLKARDAVADAIKPYSQIQANTRREIAEGLMRQGWLDVRVILRSLEPPQELGGFDD